MKVHLAALFAITSSLLLASDGTAVTPETLAAHSWQLTKRKLVLSYATDRNNFAIIYEKTTIEPLCTLLNYCLAEEYSTTGHIAELARTGIPPESPATPTASLFAPPTETPLEIPTNAPTEGKPVFPASDMVVPSDAQIEADRHIRATYCALITTLSTCPPKEKPPKDAYTLFKIVKSEPDILTLSELSALLYLCCTNFDLSAQVKEATRKKKITPYRLPHKKKKQQDT